MTPDTAFTKREFERLGRTTNEAEAVHSLRPRIDRLIAGLNNMTVAREIDAVRAIWNPGLKPGTFFRPNIWMGVDYAHGSAGHWYVFHRGGRWEPQFNIGMYGLPGAGYLRVGLGFGLTAESRDPDRVAGFAQVRALFAGFHHLAKRDLRSSLATNRMGDVALSTAGDSHVHKE